jgi:hypothetical protein
MVIPGFLKFSACLVIRSHFGAENGTIWHSLDSKTRPFMDWGSGMGGVNKETPVLVFTGPSSESEKAIQKDTPRSPLYGLLFPIRITFRHQFSKNVHGYSGIPEILRLSGNPRPFWRRK